MNPEATMHRRLPPATARTRLTSMVQAENTALAVANAAGDAVRALYAQAARQGHQVDVTTLTITTRLIPRGVAVSAVADRKGE